MYLAILVSFAQAEQCEAYFLNRPNRSIVAEGWSRDKRFRYAPSFNSGFMVLDKTHNFEIPSSKSVMSIGQGCYFDQVILPLMVCSGNVPTARFG